MLSAAPSGADGSATILENTSYTFAVADFGFSDPFDNPPNAFSAVRLTTRPPLGVVTSDGAPVGVGQFIPVADIAAGKLKFTPATGGNGVAYVGVRFQVKDNGGTFNGGADLDPTPSTFTIDVTPLNSAPSGRDNTYVELFISSPSVLPHTFTLAEFGFSDYFDSPANSFLAVKIATLPATGNLTNNEVLVTAGQFISAADIAAGRLKFSVPSIPPGFGPLTSFTFQVQDDGGTASGGIDLDPSPNTAHLVIEIPCGGCVPFGHFTLSTLEDTPLIFAPDNFLIHSPTGVPQNLRQVRIETLPNQGTMLIDGFVPVFPGQFIPASKIADGQFRYIPPLNFNSSFAQHPTFSYRAEDDNGLDPLAFTIGIRVESVNDSPINQNKTVTAQEDTSYTFLPSDFPFFDFTDQPPNNLQAVQVVSLPLIGALLYNGLAAPAGEFVAASDIAAGKLKFTYPANVHGSAYASFTFRAQDDGGTASGGRDLDFQSRTVTIDVAGVNDPPSGGDKIVVTSEDAHFTFTVVDFSFSDLTDSSPNGPPNSLLGIKIASLPALGRLELNGQPVEAGQIVSAGLLFGSLRFVPEPHANGLAYTAFTFQVIDNGGAFNGGIDTDPTPNTITINVTPVNDAPSGTDKVINPFPQATLLEDGTYAFAAADFGFSDSNDSPPNQFLALRIVTLPTRGALFLSGSQVDVGTLVPVANLSALTFRPAPNESGFEYAKFTFQVRDSGGTANGGIDFDLTPNTITINVQLVNDAPSGTDGPCVTVDPGGPGQGGGQVCGATILEDSAYTFSVSDFGFSDPNDSPPNSLLAVRVTTQPTAGTLYLANNQLTNFPAFAPVSSIASGHLRFVPAANANGTPYSQITFQVQDDGGTIYGGMDVDPTPNTLTFNVTPVNDPPSGQNRLIRLGCGPRTLSIADFGYSDPNDSPPNEPLAVKIVAIDGFGTLTNAGVPIGPGQFISYSDIAAERLVYTSVGGPISTIRFQVQDTGGTADGGADLDPTIRFLSFIELLQPGLPPNGLNNTVTTVEDATYVFQIPDFPFSDSNSDNLKAIRITTLPPVGVLRLNGAPVEQGQYISVFDIAMRRFTYTPSPNANGTPLTSFLFQVQDDGTLCGGPDEDSTPATLTIIVTSVNDSPSGADSTRFVLEDTAFVLHSADFGFTDPLDSPANSLLAVRIQTLPSFGTLTKSGVAVTVGQSISVADIVAGNLRFIPAPNVSGVFTSLSFFVQDDGGIANGGLDISLNSSTITLHLFSGCGLGAPPIVRDTTVQILEDREFVFIPRDFDPADGIEFPDDPFDAVKILTVPLAGTVTMNGVTVTAGQFVSRSDVAIGLLRYQPPLNAFGNALASFVFQVHNAGDLPNMCDDGTGTVTFNVTAVNDAPSGADQTLIANTTVVFSPFTFGFTDPFDTPANALAAVKIVSLPNVGSLTVNGQAATVDQFVPVSFISIGLFQYSTPSGFFSCDSFGSFSFQVRDNGGTANGGIDLDSTPNTVVFRKFILGIENSPPSGTDGTVTTLEDVAYAFAAADFGFSDADGLGGSLRAVKVTTLPVLGSLRNDGQAVAAGQFIPLSDITAGKFAFVPPENASGAALASFFFQVQDDGGAAGCGADLDPTANLLTINVTPVNDPPIGENRALNFRCGPRTLTIEDFGFSDPLDNPPNNPLAIMMSATGSGTLTNNGVTVAFFTLVPYADIAAGKLVYTPPATFPGGLVGTVQFQVQDDGGTANGGLDGQIAIGNLLKFLVTPVPGIAPSGTNHVLTTQETQTYSFQRADFPFTDANNDYLKAVIVASLPATGTLQFNGLPVEVGQNISAHDIAMRRFTFTPASNNGSPRAANFTIRVQDDGGTGCGGADTDPTPSTITINLTPENDPPSGTDSAVVTPQGVPYIFRAKDFGFIDPLDSPANNLAAVKIDALPASGALTNGSEAVVAGQTILVGDILAGQLRYTPPTNATGVVGSFEFSVKDDGGTASGGIDLDPTPNTLTIHVNPLCLAPAVIRDRTVLAEEDRPFTFSLADFTAGDPSGGTSPTFTGVKIVSLAAAGTLTLNGLAVASDQVISLIDINAGQLQYLGALNAHGAAYAKIDFQIVDNAFIPGCGDDGIGTITIDVASVNDPPTSSSWHFPLDLGVTRSFAQVTESYLDINDAPPNPLAAVKILTLPSAGLLTLDGIPVTEGAAIPAAALADGSLQFTAPLVTGSFSFSVQYQDDGGTANGASDTTRIHLINFDVIDVNHAPTGADHTVTLNEKFYTFAASDFGFSDPDDIFPNNLLSVKIESVPFAGNLTLNGVSVAAGQFVAAQDIAAGRLVYRAAANRPGVGFLFRVKDDGGTATGGVDLDPSSNWIDFTAFVRNPPSGANKTIAIEPAETYSFTESDFGFSDSSDTPPDEFFGLRINTLPIVGQLTQNGSIVSAGQIVSATAVRSGQLRYTAPSTSQASASFTFSVIDDGELPFGQTDPTPNTISILVTPINDSPRFTKGPNVSASDESGPVAIDNWATAISTGSLEEASQELDFVVQFNSNPAIFSTQPAIDDQGKLTFTPQPNVSGTAQVTVVLRDGGGTANGGIDTSAPQVFSIEVFKLREWHNAMVPLDVSGDCRLIGDGVVESPCITAGDALDVINFLNAFGAQAVPDDGRADGPYCDTSGDGFVAAGDALDVINFLNANVTGPEGESAEQPPVVSPGRDLSSRSESHSEPDTAIAEELATLLALDVIQSVKKRR